MAHTESGHTALEEAERYAQEQMILDEESQYCKRALELTYEAAAFSVMHTFWMKVYPLVLAHTHAQEYEGKGFEVSEWGVWSAELKALWQYALSGMLACLHEHPTRLLAHENVRFREIQGVNISPDVTRPVVIVIPQPQRETGTHSAAALEFGGVVMTLPQIKAHARLVYSELESISHDFAVSIQKYSRVSDKGIYRQRVCETVADFQQIITGGIDEISVQIDAAMRL